MNQQLLGKTGFKISEIGTGTWQVGGKWGTNFNYANAEAILNTSVENGINFIDTADVYSDGESEKAIGKFLRTYKEKNIRCYQMWQTVFTTYRCIVPTQSTKTICRR